MPLILVLHFALIFKELKNIVLFCFVFLLLCLWRSFLFSWMKWKDDHSFIHSFIQQKFLPSWSFHSSEGTPKMKILMYMLIGIHTKEKIKQNKYRMMGDYPIPCLGKAFLLRREWSTDLSAAWEGEVFRDMSEDIQSLGRASIRSMLAMLKDCQERYLESQRRVKSGQVQSEESEEWTSKRWERMMWCSLYTVW